MSGTYCSLKRKAAKKAGTAGSNQGKSTQQQPPARESARHAGCHAMHDMIIHTCPRPPSPLPLLYGASHFIIGRHIDYVGIPERSCV